MEYLRVKSSALDSSTADPMLKGVNFVSKVEPSAANPKISLSLKNVTLGQAAKYVAELSGCKLWVQPYAVTILVSAEYEKAVKINATPVWPNLVFPKVEFSGATLAQAVEFVRVKSLVIDPAKQGLNIILKPGCNPAAKLSLALKNVPASEVLRYCADLTAHKLAVEDNVFVITP